MFAKLLLTSLMAMSACAIEYDLSNVDWSKVDYGNVDVNNLPFFVLWGGAPVTRDRLDPVMTPGQFPSQHLHEFTGANVVSAGMTQADLSKATCSTFQARADKSSYWNPALFFQDPATGAFTQVPGKEGNNRKVYYMYKTVNGQYQEGISEFPQGFQMITGDPHATTLDAMQDCSNTECGYHQMGGKVASWTCQGAGNGATAPGFPKGITDCPGGLRGQVMFPDCWNGQPFNPAAPHAHVAFSTGDGLPGCPSTHQAARFPQIYMEVNYDISQFVGKYAASDSPFVLAFGDKTGFGFHADFMNGWDAGALATVMKTCRKGDGSNPTTLADNTCFGQVGGMYSAAEVSACSLSSNKQQKLASSLNALPGCQTLTTVGSTVNLKTCASTVATVNKRPEPVRIAAGHGRFVAAKV